MRRPVRSSHFLLSLKHTYTHTHSFLLSCLYGVFTKGFVDITHLSTHLSWQWVMKWCKHSFLYVRGVFTVRRSRSSWLERTAAVGFVTAVKFWWVWQHEHTKTRESTELRVCLRVKLEPAYSCVWVEVNHKAENISEVMTTARGGISSPNFAPKREPVVFLVLIMISSFYGRFCLFCV